MTMGKKFLYEFLPQTSILISLLFWRVLFAALALTFIFFAVYAVRKKISLVMRSWLWGLCVPALFLPFEHAAVALAARLPFCAYLSAHVPGWGMLAVIIPLVWAAGLMVSAVNQHLAFTHTLRLLKTKSFNGCAAYFYRGRSHLYLPEDFPSRTPQERNMLLLHEHQHIRQHDPLLFRVLPLLRCVFWFHPLIAKAVRDIRHDREMLCDSRVIRACSAREYGLLLLREAQNASASALLPGIVSEAGGTYERIAACVTPPLVKRGAAISAALFVAVVLLVGFAGMRTSVLKEPMTVTVTLGQENEAFPGAEKYVLLTGEGISLDHAGLAAYASSAGLGPGQGLRVSVFEARRQTLASEYTIHGGGVFTVGELATEDIFFPYYDSGIGGIWGFFFKWL